MEQTAKGKVKKDISLQEKVDILRAVGLKPGNRPLNLKTVNSLDNFVQAALNPEEVFLLMIQVKPRLLIDQTVI